jgi:hypothetical protein
MANDYSDLMTYQPATKTAGADYSDLMAYKTGSGMSGGDLVSKFGTNLAMMTGLPQAAELAQQAGILQRPSIAPPLNTGALATGLRVAGMASAPLLALGIPEGGLGSLATRFLAPAAGAALASEVVKPGVEALQRSGHPNWAAGTDLAANLAGGFGAGMLPGSGNLLNPSRLAKVASGQELPTLENVIREGIGPETGFNKAGQAVNPSKDSSMLSALDSIRATRGQLGNNIGQMVAQADTAVGKLNPKSLQPQIGNAVSTALEESGLATPQSKAAVQKWFANELPNIQSLSDLHDSIKNFRNSIKGHLGQEGDLSSVPLGAMKSALSEVLASHMPDDIRNSYQQANQAFSQFATLEDGLKASTPGLSQKLRLKTPAVGNSTEFNVDPGKFSKWWNETVTPEEKAKFDPEFRQKLDSMTQPAPMTVGRLAGKLTGNTVALGKAFVPDALTPPIAKSLIGLRNDPVPSFFQQKELDPRIPQLLFGSRSAGQLLNAMNQANQ